MKINFRRKDIDKQLDVVNKAIDSNNLLVPLKGMLIIANESTIQFIGSDGNLTIKEIIEKSDNLVIEKVGKILVPAKLFSKVIKKFAQDAIISLEIDQNTLIIKSEHFNTSINLLNVEEYPIIDFDIVGSEFKIDAEELRSLIKSVSYASADKDLRIILNGVNLKAHNGELYASATNSYRLARRKLKLNSEHEFNITILSKNLRDFIPESIKGEMSINISDRKIMTKFKNTIILSKLIDGIFPDIEKIIPTNYESKLSIKKKTLLDLIDKVTVLNTEENTSIKIRIASGSNELFIESRRDEIGKVVVSTNEIEWTGQDFELSFSSTFLKNAVDNLNDNIVLEFLGKNKLFTVYNEENKEYIQLILPFRGN